MTAHSVTKYIGGHHDLLAGCVIGKSETLQRVWDLSMTLGALSAPLNSWLALRGVRTLALRIRQHNSNAMAAAKMLQAHPKVEAVHYPGLPSHPQHDLALRQMKGFGACRASFSKDGYDAGARFLAATRLIQNACSLGGVDSLAIQPAAMSAGRLPPHVVAEQGIEPGMIRLAVGIEDSADLLADLERGLNAAWP